MRIGVDIDQVLLDILTPLLQYHNDTYGTNNTFDELASRNLEKMWNCSRKGSLKRVHEFYETPYFHDVTPIPGAVEAINCLSKKYHLSNVTSRTIKQEEKTIKQIQTYYPEKFENILFDNYYNGDGTIHIRKKAEVCQEYDIDVLIDDHAKNLRDLPSNVKGILFDAPWNQNETPDGVIRAYGWNDVIRKVDSLQS